MHARVDESEDHQPEDAAVAGHAAFPEFDRLERVRAHLVPAVEEDPAEPPAEHHAENRRVGDEIADLCGRAVAVAVFGEPFVNPVAAQERHHVGEAVPVQPEVVVKADDVRAELVDVIAEKEVGHRKGAGTPTNP